MKVRGIDLAVRQGGAGPLLVWGHGLLGSMDQEDEAGLLAWTALERQLRLVRFDARGHGSSEATLDPAGYVWPELARDLWALVDGCGAEQVLLGGVSMGCATALHAAVASPQRLGGLVLMAPPTAWRTRPRQARFYRIAAELTERCGLGPFRWLGSLPRPGAGSPLAALQRSTMEQLRNAHPRAVAAAMHGAADSDLPAPEALARVEAPALILAWPGDPTHPVSTAKRLAKLLPDAQLRVARSWRDVDGWTDEILRFVADLSPSRPRSAPSRS